MLFISILLSVWFVLWLIKAMFTKDALQLIVSWINDMYEDEDIDPLLEKSDGKVYHLSCEKCKHDWWSLESSTNYCPNCGEKLNKD